jgi:excisionase family DNA binding protein
MTPQPETDQPLLVGRQKAAWTLGVSVRSLDYLIAKGELPSRRIGRRILIPHASLVAWCKRDHPDCFDAGVQK